MTDAATPRLKITYATLRADNEELHAAIRGAALDRGPRAPRSGRTRTSSAAASARATATFELR